MNTVLPSRHLLLLGVLTLLVNAGAQATVYRCGQTYQQTPCEGGKTVEVPAGPSPAEVQAAQDRAAATRQWANGMTEDRLAREKALVKVRREERNARKGVPKADAAASAHSTDPAGANVDCSETPVRHAGQVSQAEARRARKAATRCKALTAYASLPASSPAAKADTARQPLPASAAARGGR